MKNIIFLFAFFLPAIASFGQGTIENLKIVWPEEYKWKIGSNQEDQKQQMIELIPGKETIDKWTIIGTMISLKGVKKKNIPMEVAMNFMFNQAKQNAINPVLTLVERNDTARECMDNFSRLKPPKFKK